MKQFLDRDLRIYVISAGAGVRILPMLWNTPGASSYLVGSEFPYDTAVTDRALGFKPAQYTSEKTAMDLAFAAYRRAFNGTGTAVGLGITAAVTTNRPKLGPTRAYGCCITPTSVHMFNLARVAGDRLADDELITEAALELLAGTIAATEPGDQLTARAHFMTRSVYIGDLRFRGMSTSALYPGAFNPPHPGHFYVADALPSVTFSICANAPHKAALTVQDMLERSTYFRAQDEVMFSEGDPLYIDKARRYPGTRIAIGADAVERLLDPQWGVDPEYTLREFRQLRTHFDVFSRIGYPVPRAPEGFQDLFTYHRGHPAAFSSSAIRGGR